MPNPRPARIRSSRHGIRAWLLACAAAACTGGTDSKLDQAAILVAHGDLAAAETELYGVEGPRASEIRLAIENARRHRAEVERELSRIRGEAAANDQRWARETLAALLAGESDPACVERIEQLQSDLVSELAGVRRPAAARRAEPEAERPRAAPPERRDAPVAAAAGSSAQSALEQAHAARSRSQWRLALERLEVAAADRALEDEARLLRESVLSAARVEAEGLLGRARELERSRGAAEAARELALDLSRFPGKCGDASLDRLRFEAELLAARAAAPAAGGARAPRPRSAASDPALARAQSAEECAAIAESRLASGELELAAQGFREAALRSALSPWREECERRARECELRLALRAELADHARVDEGTARLLGLDGAADAAPRWEALALGELWTAAERAEVSGKARQGWCVEAIARGGESDRAQALERLGGFVLRRELDAGHASTLVAQAKGALGDGGWVFRGGRWIEGREAGIAAATEARDARAADQAALLGELERANALERDQAWERVRASGDAELASRALAARWSGDWERLAKNPNLRQLEALADERRALDQAREKALALIFDEERYFYPYNPPECPPQRAAQYPAVQREVDELVGAVRRVWEASRRVKLGEPLRQLVAAAEWTAARAREAEIELPPPPAELSFALCLPSAGDVGLAQFAWSAEERSALDESERIEARNERLWTAQERAKASDEVPGTEEREQVRITNAYRRMLGRRALGWNPRIQAAAQGHSDYMANTGDFSHNEKGDPKRRTAFDRLKLAGYERGISENISAGRGDPKSAHEGWTHSSGHHRNLLAAGHREMASGLASSYWTQNFGVDSAFLADL